MRWPALVAVLALLAGCGAGPTQEPATTAADPARPVAAGATPRWTSPGPPSGSPSRPLSGTVGDPQPIARIVPRAGDRMTIGSLGVRARIRSVRFVGARLQIPPSVAEVGLWRDGAGLTDAVGTTVLVGHVSDDRDRPGVLARLGRIRTGAEIRIRFRGREHRFQVQRVRNYPKSGLPRSVFRQTGRHRLVLITCSRRVVRPGGGFHYTENLVVTASPG
ncbi:class F sortase [Nocardioides marmoriginsengisoli]|uniref:Class F sortase n=1 Tax=Nocardioides marmoriginsengisoli TaxID=661483 RepID=A0A3N0CAL7_9ACTN|nr:class F sortase [Nocardioides marmoriginsengisoli]RNL60497.1 class F sortase [Nocardioides marmoriginsengisoli]